MGMTRLFSFNNSDTKLEYNAFISKQNDIGDDNLLFPWNLEPVRALVKRELK